MSTRSGSFLERFIRALSRGAVPQSQHDREAERQSPIRWLNLR